MDWNDLFNYEGFIWPEKKKEVISEQNDQHYAIGHEFHYTGEEWASLLGELNARAQESIEEQEGMPFCEVYHNVLIYDAYWDTELQMAIVWKVCPECNTTDKEVLN